MSMNVNGSDSTKAFASPVRGSAPPPKKWQKSAIFGKFLDFCPVRHCILPPQCPPPPQKILVPPLVSGSFIRWISACYWHELRIFILRKGWWRQIAIVARVMQHRWHFCHHKGEVKFQESCVWNMQLSLWTKEGKKYEREHKIFFSLKIW